MSITELFTYTERVENAAQAFMKLKEEYLALSTAWDLRNLIASEWQVEPLDLDEKVWDINNTYAK